MIRYFTDMALSIRSYTQYQYVIENVVRIVPIGTSGVNLRDSIAGSDDLIVTSVTRLCHMVSSKARRLTEY